MGLFNSQTDGHIARIGLYDAGNLSMVANSFGAHSAGEARKRPGIFGRPVVGDATYFERQAQRVFQRAVKGDGELSSMYLHAWSLSSRLEQAATKPYQVGGPSVRSAVELVEISEEIQARIAEKDLRVDLSGKWLDRALDISSFALRAITSPVASFDMFLAELTRDETRGRLYPGLSSETDVNRADYWLALQRDLTPAPAIV